MSRITIHQQYKETLSYLYKQLPMFQRIGPAAFKKDLGNIIALCAQLGQPQATFPSIHLAGTNGKGSTAHLLAAILQASGKRVGMYTSPHYKDFRERVKINGILMSKKYVVEFVRQHQVILEQIKPSFFEITVALAFDYFAKQKVDIAIIETGLGGRLDSTNIIQPLISVITNIGYDHQQFLGDTLEEIAMEKAGIIKKDIPVVIGETHPKTAAIFRAKAKELEASIYFADQDIELTQLDELGHHTIYQVKSKTARPNLLTTLQVNLKGDYQMKNIITALKTIELIQERQLVSMITPQKIKEGLANLKKLTYFIGRWQLLGTDPTILCDSAHNVDGLEIVLRQLKQIKKEQLHFVFGMVKDKDPGKVLSLLPTDAQYYFAKANIPRGLDASELKEEAAKYGLQGREYVSVKNAVKAAKRKAKKEDLIYVGGSIFIVAEAI